jgi:hypothetical protein
MRPRRHATEDVAAADDHRQLHAQLLHLSNVGDHAFDGGAVDAERIVTHQRFARQFEKDSLVGWFCHEGAPRIDDSNSVLLWRATAPSRPDLPVKTGLAARLPGYC